MGTHEAGPIEVDKLHESALTPFDRRVAVTIAVISAVLAYVAMLDSATHSELFSLQTTANRENIEANASLAQSQELLTLSAEAHQTAIRHKDTTRIIPLLPVEATGRAARDELQKELNLSIAASKAEADSLELRSNSKRRESESLLQQAHRTLDEANTVHQQARTIGRGELLMQLAIVICSLAILTKRSWYWYSGMALGVCGLFVARIVPLF